MMPDTSHPNPIPDELYVFYDQHCGLCQSCRKWLTLQRTWFPLHFIPWDSTSAKSLCPNLSSFEPWKEIVVMTNDQRIYCGAASWVMCLYATVKFRPLALKLAHPTLLPFAKQICHLVSRNRYRLSKLLKLTPSKAHWLPSCTPTTCPTVRPNPLNSNHSS
ncbi:MAG: DCC1-like thiol-disulfide oxidoreductase family protein [Verrucomicrobiota bacterium]